MAALSEAERDPARLKAIAMDGLEAGHPPTPEGPRAVGWGLARLTAIRCTKGKVTG